MMRVPLAAMALLLCGAASHAAEIKVITSGGFRAAYLELTPLFERATQHKLVILPATADSLTDRVQRGVAVDVVIADDSTLDELIAKGSLVIGSKAPLARSSIGMAVRAGSPKPDISSVEALKRTLLEAKSIGYSASVSGRYLAAELFPRLDVDGQIAAKSKQIRGEPVGNAVARGDVQLGFQQVSELLSVPGIDYAGPLPAAVQKVTVFAAAVAIVSKERKAATALIKFLASPSAAAIIAKSGMEPVASVVR